MRAHYVYRGGEVVYAVEDGVVTIDKRGEQSNDAGFMVMPDIAPYQSMIDGRQINSRSAHRAHLRDHGMIEVGNDSSVTRKPERQPLQSPPGLKDAIIQAANQHLRRR